LSLDYEKKINEYYNTLAPEAFNVPVEKHRLEMKTECTIRSAFFSGKRRYAQYITKKEGVPCNEIDVKGLDFKKSNFPPLFREFFEEILNKNNIIIYHDKFNRTPPSFNVLYGVNFIENLLFFWKTFEGLINASNPLIK